MELAVARIHGGIFGVAGELKPLSDHPDDDREASHAVHWQPYRVEGNAIGVLGARCSIRHLGAIAQAVGRLNPRRDEMPKIA
jgi:hypothetical protein